MTDTNKERAGRFTKRPVTIDAWLIDPANKPHPAWVHNAFAGGDIDWCSAGNGLYINTLEGNMMGSHGSYLIRGVMGELYACQAHIFAATYESEARAAKAPAAPQGDGDMLRAHAEGRVTHINNGLCPDIIEGHDTRDPECPVCQALLENHAALPAPPQGAAKGDGNG